MLIAAAVVPEAPLLLPGATGATIAEVEAVRSSAQAAVAWVISQGLDAVILVTGASGTRTWPTDTPLGAARHLGTGAGHGVLLPVGLAVLMSLVPTTGEAGLRLQSVGRAALPRDARALGKSLASSSSRVGLLVAGDGSARRSVKSPGYLDARAAAYDAAVERALAAGDAAALLALAPDAAAELLVAGRAAWQVLAGAAQGRPVRGKLDHVSDPFGVRYVVARWAA